MFSQEQENLNDAEDRFDHLIKSKVEMETKLKGITCVKLRFFMRLIQMKKK